MMNVKETMLSTIDNPYNPFESWDDWLAFDQRKGYKSLELLARLTITSIQDTEEEELKSIEEAIDSIVFENPNGMFVKITKTN